MKTLTHSSITIESAPLKLTASQAIEQFRLLRQQAPDHTDFDKLDNDGIKRELMRHD